MSTAYDTYDYPSYWQGREYEHEAEVIAIKSFLEKIPKIKKILDIGAGYGRLIPIPTYFYRADKIILADPSSKFLKLAKERFPSPKILFIKSTLENLQKKMRRNSVDLIILVRVLHHIKDPDLALKNINLILKKNGFLILEFANKRHFKSLVKEFLRGNFTFLMDIFPIELGNKKRKAPKTLPFKNYHPDLIKDLLKKNNFKVVQTRSVSNIRSVFIKKILPKEFLISLEKNLQTTLAPISFGPSVFILAQKTK